MGSKTGLEACNHALFPDNIQAVIRRDLRKPMLNYLSARTKVPQTQIIVCWLAL